MKKKTTPPPPVPRAQYAYGTAVYWFCTISALICLLGLFMAMLNTGKNMLNPHLVFPAVWEGKNASDVWLHAGGGFPGGHFYISNLSSGDGLTMFGIALGSTAALWGLLAAAAGYLKDKSYGYAAISLFLSFVILFAMAGVVNL